MASDSPRTRVDQFFASKKRKAISPGVRKVEKTAADWSPIGGKGNLDNFLESPTLAKRNIVSDINRTCEGIGSFQKETSEGGSSNAGHIKAGQVASGENSELKQFANDFLSLYCSELKSTATSPSKPELNDHKRQGSPLLVGSEDVAKKRHCLANRFESEVEPACSAGKKAEDMQSAVVVKAGASFFNASKEVVVDGDFAELQGSLRKCNKGFISALKMAECLTPAPMTAKGGYRETPKSGRGSSIFSPGEAFWNEAIQVVDGLFYDTKDIVAHADKVVNNEVGPEKLMQRESGGYLELIKEHMKRSAEVSPLPVKNLDFLFDDKKMDVTTADAKTNVPGNGEKSFCGSLDPNVAQAVNDTIGSCGNEMDVEMRHVLKTNPFCIVDKKFKEFNNSDIDRIEYMSPLNEVRNSKVINQGAEAETPSSALATTDRLDLSNWLPPEVCNIYRKKGILKLYPWQVDCLQVDGVLQKRNLVYCASTSAGKSFVAEILMLRRVILTGKIALLVLPYVSICSEKAEHLEGLLEPLGKHVRSYYGNQGGGTLPKDTSVAVCTIEKANTLLNRLLEEARLSEVGIIVIDELHMVGDQSRGYLLELMLTKLRYASGEGNLESSSGESSGTSSRGDLSQGLQIVGMSATMPNVAAVADWLQAALYQTDFRPVPLEEYIKVGNTIFNRKMDIVRTIPRSADLGGKDPDHIVELCNEIVQEGHSVLIFCSSRKGCESTARHVAKFLKKFSANLQNDSEFVDATSAIEALRKSPAGLDPTLEETLPSGVAYHHAGLTVEEREIIETCYRRGLVRVLTATSTLAAGVNLPARRVIFRQPRIGRDFLDGTRYRQMAGRAGRTGIDTKGESVLICKPEELKKIIGVLNESCPPLQSCLSEDKNGMTHAILEVVAGGIVQTADDIHRYVRCTLLNSTKPFNNVVKSAQDSLRWLCHGKFLEWDEDTKLYSSTPLGRASFGSSLCPEESLIVLDDLSRAREGFVLSSDLHLVYLVTPINVEVEPDWELYYQRFMELSARDQSVGNRVGVSEPFLMCMAHGAPIRPLNRGVCDAKGMQNKLGNRSGTTHKSVVSDERTLRVCRRFYVALMLARLVQEAPVAEVCEAFKVARGMVQSLQENAGRFASMVSVFCERLGWHDLEGLVAKFQNRVSFGVRAEIVELTTIPYVKGSRARLLYKAGLRTPLAIAEASIPEIAKALFDSSSWASQEGSAQRRIQLGVAKKVKNGARRIVLDKAEEARMAAFTAFKSLGFSVPQFSQPLLPDLSENLDGKMARATSSGDDANSALHFVEQSGEASSKPATEHRNPSVITAGRQDELMKPLDVGLVAPAELISANILPCSSGSKSQTLNVLTNFGSRHNGASDDKNTNVTSFKQLNPKGEANREHSSHRERFFGDNKTSASKKGPANASSIPGGFDYFLEQWERAQEFYFDIHYNKRSDFNSAAPFEVCGIAVCWDSSPVYYVNLPKDLLGNDHCSINASDVKDNVSLSPLENLVEKINQRWKRIVEIMGKRDVKKFSWNLKVQVQVLKNAVVSVQRLCRMNHTDKSLALELVDGSYLCLSPIHVRAGIDMSIVAWILSPDEEKGSNPKLEKEVKKRLSVDAIAAADCNGRWKNQMRRAAHNGCCHRAAQVRALHSVLWKLLISEQLVEVLENIEIPMVNVLAHMELWGIGVDMEGCLHARNILGKKLRILERKAYKLAGMMFSLYTTAEIANVLYGHLKLRIPERHNKGKQHPSTDKHCLDLLRHEHPIIPVIKEHRSLAKLSNSTLGSICSLARLSMKTQKYTLHGHWLQTSTATGRLSMEEPNLQCVEHMVEFKMFMDENGADSDTGDHHKINARDFFIPTQENWLLLTADYSQIELRLMAHFSKDASLIELLRKPNGDVFTMIAGRWTGKSEDSISVDERDQTKRLVYGILYGMGANTLAEQLHCTSEEAAEKIKSFKSSFSGVASWLREAVASCCQKGYIETLKGRKRFLSKIKLGNRNEKSRAQRQAVNSICQGSAADIIKIAMINIHSVIVDGVCPEPSSSTATKFHMLKDRCHIVLQVHDELVLEVDPSVLKEAALLLKESMEGAASLLVPLQVKLKTGRTWGSLEPFQTEFGK